MIKNGGVPLWERGIALLLLSLLSPLLLVLLIWVKCVSPGPVLFLSERIGKNGEIFRLFKLRTMVPDAPQVVSIDLRTMVPQNDRRLIPGASILRKGFDEMFQLVNIVRGEMRFIGPRPDLAWMKRNYLPAVLPRLSVPPGITGWAQILGSRNFSTREGYQLDLWYVAHRTFWLDLLIVVWTPLYIVLWFPLPAGLRERCLKEMGSVGPLFAGEIGEGLVP